MAERCPDCDYLYDVPSVNVGSRTPRNRFRIQRRCSNKACPHTVFYSDPLEPSTADNIVRAARQDPTFLHSLGYMRVNSNLLHTQLYSTADLVHDSNVDTSCFPNNPFTGLNPTNHTTSLNPTTSNATPVHISTTPPVNPPPTHPSLTNSPSTSTTLTPSQPHCNDGRTGIFCANKACVTATGSRRKGHIGCQGLYCKSCCQGVARSALQRATERGSTIYKCSVGKHRLTGVQINSILAKVAPTFRQPSVPPLPPTSPKPSHDRDGGSQEEEPHSPHLPSLFPSSLPVQQVMQPPSRNPSLSQRSASSSKLPTSSQPRSTLSVPIAAMWQEMSSGWVQARQDAMSKEEKGRSGKTMVMETKAQKRMQVQVLCWTEEGKQPMDFPLTSPRFPDFCLADHQVLCSILCLSDDNLYAETFIPSTGRWSYHSTSTIREVITNQVLLYRCLPSGVGKSLVDCPGLNQEVEKLRPRSSKRKRDHSDRAIPNVPIEILDDDDDNETPRKKIRSLVPSTPKTIRQRSLTPLVMSSPIPRPRRPSIQPLSFVKSRATSPDDVVFLAAPPPSQRQVGGTLTTTFGEASKPLCYRPWANDRPLYHGGKRTFPSSFYAINVFEGFDSITTLTNSRSPRVCLRDAFQQVFGLPYAKSTYSLHHTIYLRHPNLVKKYHQQRRIPQTTYLHFKKASESVVPCATIDTDLIVIDDNSDVDDLDVDAANSTREPSSFHQQMVSELLDNGDGNDHPGPQCPYCDDAYPGNPTKHLQDLRVTLDAHSRPCPMPGHPQRRSVNPVTLATSHCARHRLEHDVIPLAREQGWPLSIQFDLLHARILDFHGKLLNIIHDPWSSPFIGSLLKQLRKYNSLHVFGHHGEYKVSSSLSAGYYGDRGFEIIASTLLLLFPLEDHDDVCIHADPERMLPTDCFIPFPSFLDRILVQHVTILLILEDRPMLDINDAIEMMFASADFGRLYYPVDSCQEVEP
ncbi:hypothetical protein QCA50_017346 [Cerrena zonata]|uniref:Restriction of telomere capping protein 4 n=1 Tax=Cerrena zonata TaxID=2478898 RepID=A0AAW0FJC1_9APHY